ncbi:MAG: type II toxin-antitoxin system RelE/ParE family toxin [Gammaproteobacteria bacterium]
MKPIIKLDIEIYTKDNGCAPVIEWLESLDKKVRYRVKERLDRIALGNLGDYKTLSEGVCELRLAFGPGFRIYFSKIGDTIILLLNSGNKSTQNKDIKQAVAYWKDYLSKRKIH